MTPSNGSTISAFTTMMLDRVSRARHLCQEARTVLTSLRGGPPHVARGDLAQDLMDLRERIPSELLSSSSSNTQDNDKDATAATETTTSQYARPFLNVIQDPRASGPHTLVALRSLHRLLQAGTLQTDSLANLTTGLLACKFEQTDPGADEAVEMAIADVLCLVIQLNSTRNDELPLALLQDALSTLFITRNTFVHSTALCYHLEDTLTNTVLSVQQESATAQQLLEFLVQQLLHTPLVGGDGLDESTREAQLAHDATRVLCLRLVRTALTHHSYTSTESLRLIQDDLCLSLLMTGQAIWAYHDHHSNISPGFVTTEVLTELCATLSLLWNTLSLRQQLTAQFETIFTGFYTRALVLLRKRKQAVDSLSYNANLIFDAEVEIILESLVDILCLHNHDRSIADNGDGGSLESIFAAYDCHMRRSDVAMGLVVELCRCCGGTVDAEGDATLGRSGSFQSVPQESETVQSPDAPAGEVALQQTTTETDEPQPWRQVPAHLKELCAQAIMGGMRCLFLDDHASPERVLERSKRKRSILLKQVTDADDVVPTGHFLRDLKSKKRLMRKAARIFNKKSSRGISFLLDSGLVPDPVTPASVAQFLRNGIVVGLDKKAVGQYLGEAGKSPVAGKSPPNWERDWFHKEVLQIFCSLFRFENQSLLDGLRMFLASFRLPGEAQQIDRILQAFSDSCGQVCDESHHGRLKLFSDDPKRSSDAAYLLSFSIIMLNTDQHNANIREDRKMTVDDFVKNNTDYGRDITDKGKELPREYLEGIYHSIREEEIRTEGEGADGAMTVERWKDVLRCAAEDNDEDCFRPSQHDVEDLTELVLEHTWKPMVSAIGALWGATFSRYTEAQEPASPNESAHSSMLGVQGARLGMDMAIDLMEGVRMLGRIDVFRKIFSCVCDYTGLVGEYTLNGVERTWALTNSLECQSAVQVAFHVMTEAGEDLDEECWRFVWSIIFELRDLKLITRGMTDSIFHESDPDLLSDEARRDWNMCLAKGDMEFDASAVRGKNRSSASGMLGAFGRALFGSETSSRQQERADGDESEEKERSCHGKEDLVLWDECAPSDDEPDVVDAPPSPESPTIASPGARFESQLIQESEDLSRQIDMPVTGLERAEETRRYQISPRARVRYRFRKTCRIESLVGDSRFMDEDAIRQLLKSLVALVSQHLSNGSFRVEPAPRIPSQGEAFERNTSDTSSTNSNFTAFLWHLPLSPASEAFAEVLLCEIALKNRDRLKELWDEVLQDHYMSPLTSILVKATEGSGPTKIPVDPGLEKRITGLIRLSVYAMQKPDLANDILSTWKYVLPMNRSQLATSPLRALHKHMGEGLWRMVARVDDLLNLKEDGWEGLVSLFYWCAMQSSCLKPIRVNGSGQGSPLPEDDVAIQCYRSLHLILNTKELEQRVPCSVADSLRALVSAGEKRNYSQLSVATLDLLYVLYEKKISFVESMSSVESEGFWKSCWRKMVEAISESIENSSDPSVRQHALSMLTDLFLDKQGVIVPAQGLVAVLSEVCVPLAGRCITRLKMGNGMVSSSDELMIEFELCIGLIFKPLRHHMKHALGTTSGGLSTVWKSVLAVLEDLLTDKQLENEPLVDEDRRHQHRGIPENLKATMKSLASEHFQNLIMALISAGVLLADPKSPGDLTSLTWEASRRMGMSESSMQEWRKAAGATEESS